MGELLSIGGLAEAVDRSPALLRRLEKDGILPPALRLVGSDRRAYRAEDVPRIRQILAERTTRRQKSTAGTFVGESPAADDNGGEAA